MSWMTRKIIILLLGSALLLAAGSWYFWPQTDETSQNPVIPPQGSAAEQDLLAASHGLARRDGASLSLVEKSGEVVTFTDHLRCGDLPCPKQLALSFVYLGWDEKIVGYRLKVAMERAQELVLTYGEDEPSLVDARHPDLPREPMAMPGAPPPKTQTDDSLSSWLNDLTREREQSEKTPLAAHADRVSRDGRTLLITLKDGKKLALEDDLVCGQIACPPQISRSFDYVGSSPDGALQVVHEEGNEVEQGLLIDDSGAVLPILSVPSFSPDGKFAVAAIADLEASAPRRLEVWDLAGGKATLSFSLPAREEDDTVYELIGWVDSTHLRLKRGPWGSDRRTAVMLAKDSGAWHIEEGGNAN